jgi:hypothetical protein
MAAVAAPKATGSISQEEQLNRLVKKEEKDIPSYLRNWHTALHQIGYEGEIAPLPYYIREIMEERSPLQAKDCKVKEDHLLYYDPPGTLNDLVARLESRAVNPKVNPLKFERFEKRAKHYCDVPSEGEWILISKDVLEGSRNTGYLKQVAMIQELSKKSFADYQIPTFRAAIAATFLHKIATGEDLFPLNYEEDRPTYTFVQERVGDWRLIVGGFCPQGLYVGMTCLPRNSQGIAVQRKLK